MFDSWSIKKRLSLLILFSSAFTSLIISAVYYYSQLAILHDAIHNAINARTSIFLFSLFMVMMFISCALCLYAVNYLSQPLKQISKQLSKQIPQLAIVNLLQPIPKELQTILQTINHLTTSLAQTKRDLEESIEQATAELTETLETIEQQNIELDMARKQAETMARVKTEFLANISHEIRTPMNGVIGFTHLLQKTSIDSVQNDYLLTIERSAYQLLSIIEDILDFSKIDAGKMTLDNINFSIHDCVEEVITLLSTQSRKKKLELIPLIYKDVPEQIIGDPIRLKQILTNLISNAVKFTEKGSVVVRVSVDEKSDPSDDCITLKITISDTGIGMTDEQIEKLFQPFSQLNQQINRHHDGTGLGLVISKKLIEQMQGNIQIESKSNEGTSFSFTFKTKALNDSEQVNLSSDNQFTEQSAKEQLNLSWLSVYLYDSHPMALLAMKQLLCSWNIKVSEFQNINKLHQALVEHQNSISDLPLIMLGFADYDQQSTAHIERLISCQHRGIISVSHNENYVGHQSSAEGVNFIDNKILQHLTKPLSRKQLRQAFENFKLLPASQVNALPVTENIISFSQLKVLVVDDNPDNLKLITILLEDMQIEVTQAYDGLSAIELCKDKQFNLVFMDIRMPGLDGIESLQRIRHNSLNNETPIIALTAHAMAGEKELLMDKGFQDYITKPILLNQLQRLLNNWTHSMKSNDDVHNKISEHQIFSEVLQESYLDRENNTNETPINWEKSLHISGGREIIAEEMLQSIISEIPKLKLKLQEFEKYNSRSERHKLADVIHKFHGLTCYSGVTNLQQSALDCEQQLRLCSNQKNNQKNNQKKNIAHELTALQLAELINDLILEMEAVLKVSSHYLGTINGSTT